MPKPEVGVGVAHRWAAEEVGHHPVEGEAEGRSQTEVVEAAGGYQQHHRSGREDQDLGEGLQEEEGRHSQEHQRKHRERPH